MRKSEAHFEPSRQFVPEIGSHLTVQLPGEVMRCRVDQVIDTDTVIVEIDSMPMAKTHLFRIGDKTGARRRSENGRDVWEALSDRDFLAGRSPNVPPEPEKPAARAKPKRKAA